MEQSPTTYSRTIWIVVTAITILVIAVGINTISQKKDTTASVSSTSSMANASAQTMTKRMDSNTSQMMETQSGTYTTYSASESDSKKSQNRILFFNANWCPTCKSAVKNIQANGDSISSGVAILSVDYDANPDLKRQYGVTYQHTFVKIDSDGKLLAKASGLDTVEEINKFANNQ